MPEYKYFNLDKLDEKRIKQMIDSCPYYQLLGIKAMKIEKGFARLKMSFDKKLTQLQGVVHGGAIASIADSAMAMALILLIEPGELIATIEFKINFLSSVKSGEVIAEAVVIHKGSRVAVGDIEVKSKDGKLISKAIATYIISKPKDKASDTGFEQTIL